MKTSFLTLFLAVLTGCESAQKGFMYISGYKDPKLESLGAVRRYYQDHVEGEKTFLYPKDSAGFRSLLSLGTPYIIVYNKAKQIVVSSQKTGCVSIAKAQVPDLDAKVAYPVENATPTNSLQTLLDATNHNGQADTGAYDFYVFFTWGKFMDAQSKRFLKMQNVKSKVRFYATNVDFLDTVLGKDFVVEVE